MEHVFVGEALRALWRRGVFDVEVLRSDFDAHGYDLVVVRGNLIVNTTYKGLHGYGKRSRNKGREIISRPVAPIVDEKTWDKAQANLQAHFLFGIRSTRNHYLFRGLMKCGCCGLTYVGVSNTRPSGRRDYY